MGARPWRESNMGKNLTRTLLSSVVSFSGQAPERFALSYVDRHTGLSQSMANPFPEARLSAILKKSVLSWLEAEESGTVHPFERSRLRSNAKVNENAAANQAAS